MSRPCVLIADDQPDVVESLRLLLKGDGYDIVTASSPAEVIAAVEKRDLDVVLMDLNYTRDTTSGQEGVELLDRLRELDRNLPVVVMTAWGSVELAVEAMRRGARDFVEKPWDNERLLATLRNHTELVRALRKGEQLEAENRVLREGDGGELVLIAEAPAMKPVLELIERVGPSDANVLLTGENGTGKSLIARVLHSVSPRASRPLVTVNSGAIPDSVFESELFGHVRGAFTDAKADRMGRFEMAAGGTLFLDEIANLPLGQQAKLLRVVESGEFERVGGTRTRRADVRILSATNTDPDEEVAAGRFRKDLLFRLKTVEIRVPPLRQRRADLEPLARHFLERHCRRHRQRIEGFEPAALEALGAHSWPGNVRELDHAVERAVLMARGSRIEAADLGLLDTAPASGQFADMNLEEAERWLIRKALSRHQGNVTLAAVDLGLSRSALYRRLEKHRIE